ncbi:CsbD family protein [Caballeronia arvi]|uniref:CsbD family protein n=1 Tax=Caballeronia arvi TaxID=1777135 RepID=A0A158EXF5_9BURK|nr:CsbD family protein [Caballeronia arvi]SAL12212.1 CsbD family protein [Caballeronia arvi]
MDKNRIEGTARQMKGIVREAVGKATGSRGTQIRGTAEKMAGKMQAKLGAAADAVRRVKK